MRQSFWVDRGQAVSFEKPPAAAARPRYVGVARLGSFQTSGTMFCVWIQLRGSSWVESKDGRFRLRAREWIALDKEARPQIQAERDGIAIGLALDTDALQLLGVLTDSSIYAGRGAMSQREARLALRLWRAAQSQHHAAQGLRQLLLHLAGLQRALAEGVQRCPGHSRLRKRQVFARMQRARLYLEGNSHRVVRMDELATLTKFSGWYVSKTFQNLYEESPQALAARLRLERAAMLLSDTDMAICEVAMASGFDNGCSFARAFRSRFGMPASRYRASLKIGSPNSAKSSTRL